MVDEIDTTFRYIAHKPWYCNGRPTAIILNDHLSFKKFMYEEHNHLMPKILISLKIDASSLINENK